MPSVYDQSIGSSILTVCQVSNIYRTCNLEHNSKTFELPALSVLSEENSCHVKMVYGAILCFNVLTRLPIYYSCLRECRNPALLLRSIYVLKTVKLRLTLHQHEGSR